MIAKIDTPIVYGTLGLSDKEEQWLSTAMLGFKQKIQEQFDWPGELIREMPPEFRDLLASTTERETLNDVSCRIWRCVANCPRIVVACDPNHPLARSAKRESPWACHGATAGCIAAVYCLKDEVVWHEALHLLDADECYTVEGGNVIDVGPTCGTANCIMQYDATGSVIDNGPILCCANRQLVQQCLAGGHLEDKNRHQ